MTNTEMIEKVDVLLADPAFRTRISSCASFPEVAALFSEAGLYVSSADLETSMNQMYGEDESGELTEADLESVAGGFSLTGTSFLAGCICVSLSNLKLGPFAGHRD